jgi:hypothetical protein
MYYSSFFAAKALLAMHGGWFQRSKQWLEVANAQPGSLQMTLNKTGHPLLSGSPGSHRDFWVVFYSAVKPLNSYIPAAEAFAIQPVNSSATWLIDNRNKYNYCPSHAISLLTEFTARFDGSNMPGSFPGVLKVFSNIAGAMQKIVHDFRTTHLLASDIFSGDHADLSEAVNSLIRANRAVELDSYANNIIGNFSI